MTTTPHPLLLIILDGFGVNPRPEHNAIAAAKPVYWNSLLANYPNTTLEPGGRAVGLPQGQFGNSEVGHLNLGAGRVVYQDITRIDKAIEDGDFFTNPVFLALLDRIGARGKLHLMGLVSDGGVHSSDRHYLALLRLFKERGVPRERLCFHVITDGRDTAPTGGAGYTARLADELERLDVGFIASVSGRYYAMDRDTNWDRTRLYYDCVTLGQGEVAGDAARAIHDNYAAGVTDEFIRPTLIAQHGAPLGRIEKGDALLYFNFRADRARQFCRALAEGDDFDQTCFKRAARPEVSLTTMTGYLKGLRASIAYQQEHPRMTIGEYLSSLGVAQFRCAETEKYAHVTYFFNGGMEAPFPGEERVLVPSPKVATYDLQPEMSLPFVAEKLVEALDSGRYPFVLSNFANGDMVGHTGVFAAAVKAVGAIDDALRRVVERAQARGCHVLITADHGNCEEMANESGETLTNHSHNPVPLLLLPARDATRSLGLADGGTLADVAPTALELMGLDKPAVMTGKSLLRAV